MTKYYKLLKDLPTFKKGDLFRLSDEGSLFLVNPGSPHWKPQVRAYHRLTLEHFPNILKDWFKEVEVLKGRWKPKEGDGYFYIRSYEGDDICPTVWGNDDFDQSVNEIGNVFRTEDEAKKALEWLKARNVLFDDAKGFKPNWEDDMERKWCVYWAWTEEEDGYRFEGLDVDYDVFEVYSPGPYFATAEDAKASIKAHEKEWKIYLLGSGRKEK